MLNEGAYELAKTKNGIGRPGDEHEPTIDLIAALYVLWRRRVLIGCILLACVSSAVIYAAIAIPRYTATSMLLFDNRVVEPFEQRGYLGAEADSSFVDSQVEVLRSEHLARSVVKKLDLLSDPECAPRQGSSRGPSHSNQLARCIQILKKNATIKRVGLTYIVSIAYRSLDPTNSARISNAIADAYISNELESKSEAARRANVWLQDRLSELRRLAENTEAAMVAYKSTSDAPDAVTGHVDQQQFRNMSTQRRILLRDLETSAQTYRALHEKLLQSVAEFTEKATYPATSARIVSPASPPLEKSEPQSFLLLVVASVVGVVAAVGAAFTRDYFDGGLRSPTDVEQKTGVTCLGVLPNIAPVDGTLQRRKPVASAVGRNDETSVIRANHRANQTQESRAAEPARFISTSFEQYRLAVDKPLSYFAEAIRSLRVAAEIAGPIDHCKIIGVTSVLPAEGKSLVAANLGGMIAASGNKVLLIDANPRSAIGLTQKLAPEAKSGVLEAAFGHAQPQSLVWHDQTGNLDFLPIVRPISDKDCLPFASPAAMRILLEWAQQDYDYVIVDLPSMLHVTDVKAVSGLVDYFILVISRGFTSQKAVAEALKKALLVPEKLLGAMLNNADLAGPRRHSLYGSNTNRDHEELSSSDNLYEKMVRKFGSVSLRRLIAQANKAQPPTTAALREPARPPHDAGSD